MGDRLIGVLAAVLVGAAVVAGVRLVDQREPEDPSVGAAEVADDYVAAWESWDAASMADRTQGPPDRFVALHDEVRDALRPETTTIARGPVRVDGAEARTPLTIAVDLPHADRFSWTTELVLHRRGGEWRIVWEPSTLHPALRSDALTIAVETSASTREGLLAMDGTPIDAEEGFALHTLGRLEELDEERAAELGPPYRAGDEVGRYGLQAALEERLRGSGAVEVVLATRRGEPVEVLHRFEEDPAEPVTTTLEVAAQQAAENALIATGGLTALVAVDLDTGGVRAIASRPHTGYHRAVAGAYTSGAAGRLLVAAAAAGAGIDLGERVACPASGVYGGRRVENPVAPTPQEPTIAEALGSPCRTSVAALALRTPGDALAELAATLGFDDDPDLPIEAATPSYRVSDDPGERVELVVGRGTTQTTVLHAAALAAAVAEGVWRAPALVADDLAEPSGRLAPAVSKALAPVLDLARGGGIAATSDGVLDGQPVTNAWWVGVVDDLAVAAMIEDVDDRPDRARRLAERFAAELGALRDAAASDR